MKITVTAPNATKYLFELDQEDELHSRCTWAEINLDHDTYTMTAVTDCGNYSYSWHPTPTTESFRKLMARLDEGYLLDKVSSERFVFDESKALLLEKLNKASSDVPAGWRPKFDSTVEEIEDMDECSEEMFLRTVASKTEWLNQALLQYGRWGLDGISIVTKYPGRAETFARIFTQYLQPILREELKGNTASGAAEEEGKWIFESDYTSRCSNCDKEVFLDHEDEYAYCPHCGKKMAA